MSIDDVVVPSPANLLVYFEDYLIIAAPKSSDLLLPYTF